MCSHKIMSVKKSCNSGGLIETKQELTEALKNGAEAIPTGSREP